MKKIKIVLLLLLLLFVSFQSCGIFGPSLPASIQGKWVMYYSSNAKNVITLGSNTVRYQVYDYYGFLDTDWDRAIVEVNEEEGWFLDDNGSGYYWMYHLEGTTLHLHKLGLNELPSAYSSTWWADPAFDYSYTSY